MPLLRRRVRGRRGSVSAKSAAPENKKPPAVPFVAQRGCRCRIRPPMPTRQGTKLDSASTVFPRQAIRGPHWERAGPCRCLLCRPFEPPIRQSERHRPPIVDSRQARTMILAPISRCCSDSVIARTIGLQHIALHTRRGGANNVRVSDKGANRLQQSMLAADSGTPRSPAAAKDRCDVLLSPARLAIITKAVGSMTAGFRSQLPLGAVLQPGVFFHLLTRGSDDAFVLHHRNR